jgi:hypothetical protein
MTAGLDEEAALERVFPEHHAKLTRILKHVFVVALALEIRVQIPWVSSVHVLN